MLKFQFASDFHPPAAAVSSRVSKGQIEYKSLFACDSRKQRKISMSVLLVLYHHCLCGDARYVVALLLSVSCIFIQPVHKYLFLTSNS